MNRTITKIEALQELPKRIRVAAYARVSSGKEAMLNSLAAQVNYYKQLIQNNSDWEFVGVYADEALTGTKDTREEFQALIEDSRNGKIDMIITKSISRFARNTLTLLEVVRELKALEVDIFFEEQNIHTLSGEGEMILTFLATFAQEESRSVSENMKWRIKKDFEEGILWGGKDSYGYKLENRNLVLVPKEAEIVRLIYKLYLEGYGDMQIGKILNEKGYKPKFSEKWNRASIRGVLINYNYTGNLILQKTFRENHLTKLTKLNYGELDKYCVEDNHEPIISKETFFAAQELRRLKTVNIKQSNNDSIFKGRIRCGQCDKMYTFRKTKYNDVWLCSTARQKGTSECSSKQVLDAKIIEASNHILKMTSFNRHTFDIAVETVIVLPDNKLLFKLRDGKEVEYIWEYDPRSAGWTDEMKKAARKNALKRYRGNGNG